MLTPIEFHIAYNKDAVSFAHVCTEKKEKDEEMKLQIPGPVVREKALMLATGAKPTFFGSFKVKVGLSRENPIVLNDSIGREVETLEYK